MIQSNEGAGKNIQDTVDKLMEKGVPAKAAAYAASMGYLRTLKKPQTKPGEQSKPHL